VVKVHEIRHAKGGEESGQDGLWNVTVIDKDFNTTRVIVRNVFDFGYYGYPARVNGTEDAHHEDTWTQIEHKAVKWALEFSPIDHDMRM